MNDYEIVYIFDSALEESDVDKKLKGLHKNLTGKGNGEVTAVDHWGRRRLAFPIRKHENGYYVVAKFSIEADALPELERALKLEDDLLRHLVVVDEGVPTAPMSVSTREYDEGEDDDDDDYDDDDDDDDEEDL